MEASVLRWCLYIKNAGSGGGVSITAAAWPSPVVPPKAKRAIIKPITKISRTSTLLKVPTYNRRIKTVNERFPRETSDLHAQNSLQAKFRR